MIENGPDAFSLNFDILNWKLQSPGCYDQGKSGEKGHFHLGQGKPGKLGIVTGEQKQFRAAH